eukprot:gene9945-10965_t
MEPSKDKEVNPETEDLKNMLMTFRITELQEVLCTCGRPRSGRKHELLGRAVSLLRQSDGYSVRERIKNRIIELYKQRFPSRVIPASLVSTSTLYSSIENPEKSRDTVQNNAPGVISQRTSSSKLTNHHHHHGSSSHHSSTSSHNQYSNKGSRHRETIYSPEETSLSRNSDRGMDYYTALTSTALGRKDNFTLMRNGNGVDHPSKSVSHSHSHANNSTTDQYHVSGRNSCHTSMPVHPDVKFIHLPFADCQDVLIKATSLVQKRVTGYQQIQLVFHLSPLQVQTITHSKSYTLQSRVEFGVQVLLRFCLAETSCQQEDAFPSRCSIKVNGKFCPIPGQPPSSSQNTEPKKPHRPVNITSFCRLSPMVANQIQISWLPSDLGQRYAATVQLVKCVSANSLISRLKAKPERNADHSRALIKEKLADDPDIEVATSCLKVSLCCPIGKMRMTLPCRATTCNHVQCFDGSTYIQMNERKPNWTCPVCDQKAHYDQLIIDGLFTEILQGSPDSNEIVFAADGSWKLFCENDQDIKPSITTIVGTPCASKTGDEKPKDKEVCKIDLTLDSDSDEDNNDNEQKISTKPISYQQPTSQHRGPRVRQVPTFQPLTQYQYPSLYDQDFQGNGSDFYSLLPEDDRMAAELYFAQSGSSGFISQLANTRRSPSDVISLD